MKFSQHLAWHHWPLSCGFDSRRLHHINKTPVWWFFIWRRWSGWEARLPRVADRMSVCRGGQGWPGATRFSHPHYLLLYFWDLFFLSYYINYGDCDETIAAQSLVQSLPTVLDIFWMSANRTWKEHRHLPLPGTTLGCHFQRFSLQFFAHML